MARSRPVSKFQSYTYQALADLAQGVHDALGANVGTFASPSVSLADQQTAIDDLNAAILSWGPPGNRGSRASHVNLLAMRDVVRENLTSLEGYINGVAAGDNATILLAGMVPNDPKTPFGVLPAPQNLHSPFSKHTMQGQYRLRWKKVKGAHSYNLFQSVDSDFANATNVATVTKTLAVVSNPSLPSGTLQYFWVAAVGTSGQGGVSDLCAARNL